jgi:hypothetical protein
MTLHLPEQLALDLSMPLVNDGRCFRRDAAASVGLSPPALRAAVRDGSLRQVLRGVYVDSRRPDDTATRLAAIELVAPPGAVVARTTAAWARGVDATGVGPRGDPPVVECIVPPGRASPRHPGVRCHRLPLLDDDIEPLGGVRCTTPLRTAVDLLFQLRRHLALAAVDAMACAGLFTPGQLVAEVDRWQDRRGYARARRLATSCEPGAQSFGESWLRLRILDAGFPRPSTAWISATRGGASGSSTTAWSSTPAPSICAATSCDAPGSVRRTAGRSSWRAAATSWVARSASSAPWASCLAASHARGGGRGEAGGDLVSGPVSR